MNKLKGYTDKIQTFFGSLDTGLKLTLYILVSVAVTVPLAFLIGSRIILPVLVTLPAYLIMLHLVKTGERRKAVLIMLLWAFALGTAMTLISYALPARAEQIILNGAEYRDEMFRWVMTGTGTEGTPSKFIPQHLLHLGLFILLSILTMSSLSIMFGALLLNYMAFYVSQLMLHTDQKVVMFLVGWHFWSLFRIAGFVILGVVLSEIMGSKALKFDFRFRRIMPHITLALALIVTDIITKWLFAPAVGRYVQSLM